MNFSISKKLNFFGNPLMGLADTILKNRGNIKIQKVSDSFYRSSDASKNLPELAKKGIKIVLNLKTITKEELQNLTKIAKENGIEYVNIPVDPFKIKDSIPQIMDVINKSSKENPMLVHCTFGRDRTGFVTALYKNIKENIAMPEAISDMYQNGFRRLFFTMDNYLKNFSNAA